MLSLSEYSGGQLQILSYLGNSKRRHRRHPEINEQAEIKL